MFSVALQFPIGFCFLMPRVCWLLFSSSLVALGICLDYCLVLLLNWLSAPPPGFPPFPRRLPTLPVFQPHIGLGGRRPTRLGLVFQHPIAQSGGYPHQDWPLVFQRPNGPARWDLPSTGPTGLLLTPSYSPLSTCNFSASPPKPSEPLCPGRPT